MTLGEWGEWGHGALRLPLDNSTGTSLLDLADPALSATLAFLPAVLELQLGDAFRAYMLREGDKTPLAVGTSSNVEPVPALYADRVRFPFFALYRKSEAHTGHTLSWDKSVAEWEFAYVLPALMPKPQEVIAPILHAVARTIGKALRLGYHPGYESGAAVLKDAGVMSAKPGTVRYERYERMSSASGNNAEQFFRAIVGSIEVVERDVAVDGAFPAFAGTNIGIHERAADGTTVTNVAQATTDLPPTIASVTPSSGSVLGSVSVVIAGTGYLRPTIKIGGAAAVVNAWTATTVSITTPPHAAYPTFMAEVVVTNDDGQSARLPAGFTYTTP